MRLIGATTTAKGLKIRCEFDENAYPKGIKGTDKRLVPLKPGFAVQGEIW